MSKRLALRLSRMIADHDERLAALALVDRFRPCEHPAPSHAAKVEIAKVTLVDAQRRHRAAVAVGRQGIELTRTTEIAAVNWRSRDSRGIDQSTYAIVASSRLLFF